ncbi:MAG: type II secretion system GspH family protein [Gammaproteobacteria bacterium]|nr:type II secretion system GspH family protein [Gammaproteobacteria bacterium]MDH3410616.1 type II secretion system GspH family protein [Gammaproteobacteria bacterium]MDH3553783.1 type II secretion system GspH family protein [Gammaproteobacteria bacterium]
MSSGQRGFTLVELVITITLTTIVVSFMAMFISGPVRAYNDQGRRAELVDLAENSLRRITRDIHRALPNSVRLNTSGSTVALELLNTVDGARYRDRPPPGDPTKRLQFSSSDGAFNSVGSFRNITKPFSSNSHYISIYNVGVPGANAYELANVITPAGTQIDIDADAIPGEDNVRLSPAFKFAFASPGQRMFLVEGAVSYLCDTAAGTLIRYSGYAITSDQTARDSDAELLAAGAESTLITNRVSACSMGYAPGTSQRAGLVSIALAVSDTGETVSLLHQVHVDNVP